MSPASEEGLTAAAADKKKSRPGSRQRDRATRAGEGPARKAPRARQQGQAGPAAAVLRKRAGAWYVRLEAFSGRGHDAGPEAPWDLALLRQLSEAEVAGPEGGARPAAREPPETSSSESTAPVAGPGHRAPDDLLLAAAATGATTSMAFLDILDGGDFEQAACLCCYAAETASGARKATQELLLFKRYYRAESYLRSRAFGRAVAVLSRDLRREELAAVKAHLVGLRHTTDLLRAINAHPDVCVTAPPCRPETVWVYSTPGGRRMLRHLARGFRGEREGLSLAVSVASSDGAVHPRWRYRMYAATLVEGEGAARPAPSTPSEKGERLLRAIVAWTQNSLAAPWGPPKR